jgi:hypothetical protein
MRTSPPSPLDHTSTSRSDCGYGSGRSKTASTTLKIAVLAPMPNASVSTVTTANPGLRNSVRIAKRRSLSMRGTSDGRVEAARHVRAASDQAS